MADSTSFSHIVVGAGSAGCIVAARIAENPSFNVLLLEAGPDIQDPNVPQGVRDIRRVPMKGQSEKFDNQIDWDVRVDLPDGGSMNVAQGRLVGGGSSINGGTALRNTVHDCQEWEEMGNHAWRWESVEPVYAALENDRLKGTQGPHPLVRTDVKDAGQIQRAFVAGAIDNGLSWVGDLNGTGVEGTGPSPVCRQGHQRISLANTFVDPIRNQSNFHLLPNALVDRISFSGRKADGVVLIDGRSFAAHEEVIVCASAVFTPAILQRSGIGPASLLSSLSIPVIEDLPVGNNLADHACVPVVARPKTGAYQGNDFSLQMQARHSSSQHPGAIDLQMVCFSYLFADSTPQQPVSSGLAPRSLGGTAFGHVAGIGCNLNKPTSYGSVRIESLEPTQQPKVEPRYLATASDRSRLREVVRLAYRIMLSEAMQSVLDAPIGLTADIVNSDKLLDQWIQTQYSSTYHFSSTCRMAAREKGGVVDQSGCVYGTQGLRTVDASILPTIPAANTMWPTAMFAERIGQSIKHGRRIEGAAEASVSKSSKL